MAQHIRKALQLPISLRSRSGRGKLRGMWPSASNLEVVWGVFCIARVAGDGCMYPWVCSAACGVVHGCVAVGRALCDAKAASASDWQAACHSALVWTVVLGLRHSLEVIENTHMRLWSNFRASTIQIPQFGDHRACVEIIRRGLHTGLPVAAPPQHHQVQQSQDNRSALSCRFSQAVSREYRL